MATKQLSNESLQRALTKEAWDNLSETFEWTESLLEKFQDKVDWNKICENEHVHWTIPMISKYQDKINWDILSKNIDPELLTEKLVEAFLDKWNWHNLSDCNLNYVPTPHKVLMKFADKWDWGVIINNTSIFFNGLFEDKGVDFYEKYKKYIPEYKLSNTDLWGEMVSQIQNHLVKEITKSEKK